MNASKGSLLFFITIFLFGVSTAEAQFLKKLKEKVSQTVERTATNKIDQKAEQIASKQMDKMLNMDMGKDTPFSLSMDFADLSEARDRYEFDWVYSLEVEDNNAKKEEDRVTMEMYLKEGAGYWGAGIPQQPGMTLVYDAEKSLTLMFMEQDGQKLANAMKFEPVTEAMEEAGMPDEADFTITEIDGKEILGYQCRGFRIENTENVITVYNTSDVSLSFMDIYKNAKNMPTDYDPTWLEDKGFGGLMMEMQMEDKEGNKEATMRCVRLENSSKTVVTAEYQSMMSATPE